MTALGWGLKLSLERRIEDSAAQHTLRLAAVERQMTARLDEICQALARLQASPGGSTSGLCRHGRSGNEPSMSTGRESPTVRSHAESSKLADGARRGRRPNEPQEHAGQKTGPKTWDRAVASTGSRSSQMPNSFNSSTPNDQVASRGRHAPDVFARVPRCGGDTRHDGSTSSLEALVLPNLGPLAPRAKISRTASSPGMYSEEALSKLLPVAPRVRTANLSQGEVRQNGGGGGSVSPMAMWSPRASRGADPAKHAASYHGGLPRRSEPELPGTQGLGPGRTASYPEALPNPLAPRAKMTRTASTPGMYAEEALPNPLAPRVKTTSRVRSGSLHTTASESSGLVRGVVRRQVNRQQSLT